MTSKLARERLEKIKSWRETYGAGINVMLPAEEAEELACIALAAMDSEPVAWMHNNNNIGIPAITTSQKIGHYWMTEFKDVQPLYRHAQPAPVVPELMVDWQENEFSAGWNACRAAMLAAAPQSPGSEPATVPGKWIPVSERMPEREVDVQVYCPDKKEQMVAYLESNELEGYFRFATWRTGDGIYCQPTHWMPLPAAPREVK